MTTKNSIPALCKACIKLGTTTQATDAHDALLHRGNKPQPQHGATEQLFRCADCDTLWVRYIDKWGMEGPFRLATRPQRLHDR